MVANIGAGISGLISAVRGASTPFDNAEDYVSYMRDPTRVVRIEWRKVRHEKSKGLTSHSWLEVHLLDGKRLRIEIYADRGYTESAYDPLGSPSPRFFDPQSTVYDGRVAGTQDLARPLTARGLTAEAQAIAETRSYSLSEFNCHHFVLEVWNSVVMDALKTSHHPDRVKTGLLWGLEEAVGTWLQNFGGSFGSIAGPQEGAGHRGDRPPPEAKTGRRAPGGLACGRLEAAERNAASYDRSRRLQHFCRELEGGSVFLLETTGPIIPTALPPQHSRYSISEPWEFQSEAWASACLPGVGHPAMRLAERINSIDLDKIIAEIFKPKSERENSLQSNFASLSSMNSMSSLSSLSSLQSEAPQMMSRAPQADACFVALRGKEVRLAIFAVLRPPSAPGACAWRLLLLSGDAMLGDEASFTYALGDLAEGAPTTRAEDLAREDQYAMQVALRTSNWGLLVPECHPPSWTRAQTSSLRDPSQIGM